MRKTSAGASIVALALAEEVAASVQAGEIERQDLVMAAGCVGEWLAEQGLPGRWDALDVEAMLPVMGFVQQQQVDVFLLSLVGLVGHAAFNQQLTPGDGRRILLQIRDVSSNAIVSDLAGQTAGQLQPSVQ